MNEEYFKIGGIPTTEDLTADAWNAADFKRKNLGEQKRRCRFMRTRNCNKRSPLCSRCRRAMCPNHGCGCAVTA